ncbi:MAG: MutS-related protein [Gemmatimonas sp.]
MNPVLVVILVAIVTIVALAVGNSQVRSTFRVWMRMRQADADGHRERILATDRIAAYEKQRGTCDGNTTYRLDDATWDDLDLEDVFHKVDYTVSRPGQQYLWRTLRNPSMDPRAVDALHDEVAHLEQQNTLRSDIRRALAPLDDVRSATLTNLIWDTVPERPRFWWMFPILTVVSIALFVAVWSVPKALIGLIVIAAINIVLQLSFRPRVESLIPAIHQLPIMIECGGALTRITTSAFEDERTIIRRCIGHLKELKRATRWLRYEPSEEANPLIASMYVYINLAFLLDVTAFVIALESARRNRDALQGLFEAIGRIDTVQSIATLRHQLRRWCRPQFTAPGKQALWRDVYHPLVENAVPNSIDVKDASILITGSNMSGKTTFIRSVAINAIMAQAFGTVCASDWQCPPLRVATSIGRKDSVREGRSYYLAEVESVHRLIRAKLPDVQHLFVVDELYRGTNTDERVAAAYAVLEHLSSGNDIVLVATHDTELLQLLGDSFQPYHFREDIRDGALTFDYTIREGQATTRNAIALLELMRYPVDVVAAARRVLRTA